MHQSKRASRIAYSLLNTKEKNIYFFHFIHKAFSFLVSTSPCATYRPHVRTPRRSCEQIASRHFRLAARLCVRVCGERAARSG